MKVEPPQGSTGVPSKGAENSGARKWSTVTQQFLPADSGPIQRQQGVRIHRISLPLYVVAVGEQLSNALLTAASKAAATNKAQARFLPLPPIVASETWILPVTSISNFTCMRRESDANVTDCNVSGEDLEVSGAAAAAAGSSGAAAADPNYCHDQKPADLPSCTVLLV